MAGFHKGIPAANFVQLWTRAPLRFSVLRDFSAGTAEPKSPYARSAFAPGIFCAAFL